MNAKHLLAAVAILTATGVTFAQSALVLEGGVVKTVQLKDGLTVYVFNDGKMGMEGKYGRVLSMSEGHVM